MSAQGAYRVALFLVVGLASCAVHCWQIRPNRDIPPRCLQASVTTVSCADAHSFFDSLLPHPDDCELFYYCVSSTARPICRQCPAHLHFNPRLHVCDHPARAGCRVDRPTVGPTVETTASVVTDVTATEGPTENVTSTGGSNENVTSTEEPSAD